MPSGTVICDVPAPRIDLVWPRAERWIAAALAREDSGRFLPCDVRDLLLQRRMLLWLAWNLDAPDDPIDAAMVTELVDFPRLRELRVWLIGGRRLWSWARQFDQVICDFARAHGASRCAGGLRPGWARFGYRQHGAELIKEL